MIRLLNDTKLSRTRQFSLPLNALCNRLHAAPGNFGYFEYLNIKHHRQRTKVYFDADFYFDAKPTGGLAEEKRKLFIDDIRTLFAVTGHTVEPDIVLASRHRFVADKRKHKVSWRAWVTNYYIEDYTAIGRLIRQLMATKVIGNLLDPQPYSRDQLVNCVLCKKGRDGHYRQFLRPEGFGGWRRGERTARLKSYIVQHLDGSELRCNFAEHLVAKTRRQRKEGEPDGSLSLPSYQDYVPLAFLSELVMALPAECYGDHSYERWLRVLFGVMQTGRANGYEDAAVELCHEFSQQDNYDERVVDRAIESSDGGEGVTLGTIMGYARELLPKERYAQLARKRVEGMREGRRVWLMHLAACVFLGAKAEDVRLIGSDPMRFAANDGREVTILIDARANILASPGDEGARVIGNILTARAHHMYAMSLREVAAANDRKLSLSIRVGQRLDVYEPRECILRALISAAEYTGGDDLFIKAAVDQTPELREEYASYAEMRHNYAFTYDMLERLMPEEDLEEHRDTFEGIIPRLPSPSLHEDGVAWDEVYTSPTTRLPDLTGGVVVVRAGMGTGKTEALLRVLADLLGSSFRVLVVVYSRALARKFRKDLAHLGFRSYLDDGCPYFIRYPRAIVCLDSMPRVEYRRYDIVVLDEALSLLQHFLSPLMNDTKPAVCASFLDIVTHSDNILLMDAAADNVVVRTFVEKLQHARAAMTNDIVNFSRVVWSRNLHVRDPDTERCLLVSQGVELDHEEFAGSFFVDVRKRLEDGERVVVATACKSMVDRLSRLVALLKIRAVFYTSETPESVMDEHMAHINEHWVLFQLVVYSPTITSGMSFTRLHFHVRMAYFLNGPQTPAVDMCIQQLYRVRAVINNETVIYVSATAQFKQPVHAWQVEAELRRENAYLRTLGVQDALYASGNIFYPILVGTRLNRGRSMMQFYDILRNTLVEDRRVCLTEKTLHEAVRDTREAPPAVDVEAVMSADVPEQERATQGRKPGQLVCFLVPTEERYTAIKAAMDAGIATDRQLQMAHNFDVAEKFGVELTGKECKAFVNSFAGAYDAANAEQRLTKLYHGHKWFASLVTAPSPKSFEEDAASELKNTIKPSGIHILKSYDSPYKKSMYKAVEAVRILGEVLPGAADVRTELVGEKGEFAVSTKAVAEGVSGYLSTHACRDFILNLFKYKGEREDLVGAEEELERRKVEFFKKVLRSAFALDVSMKLGMVTVSAKPFKWLAAHTTNPAFRFTDDDKLMLVGDTDTDTDDDE